MTSRRFEPQTQRSRDERITAWPVGQNSILLPFSSSDYEWILTVDKTSDLLLYRGTWYVCIAIQTNVIYTWKIILILVVDVHIYPPVTGQCQTLTIVRSAHFSLQWLLRDWKSPQLLRSFQWSSVSVDFIEFLSTEFSACSKPPSRDNCR